MNATKRRGVGTFLIGLLASGVHNRGVAGGWGRGFDPERMASIELRAWKAYYRRQPMRLFALLVLANHEQARTGWLGSVIGAAWLTRAAVRFAGSEGDYDRFLPSIERGYRALGVGDDRSAEVARAELRWWVVRREIGLAAGHAAGDAITALYAALYGLPAQALAEAGRLRGLAAEMRDRGANADPDGPRGRGRSYWPKVAQLLKRAYLSLANALERA
jgi:hypothetical protein